MIRYIMHPEVEYIYLTKEFKKEDCRKIRHREFKFQNIFVNILEQDEFHVKIKIFYPDGGVIEGWIGKVHDPLFPLLNRDELFDGRFNQ